MSESTSTNNINSNTSPGAAVFFVTLSGVLWGVISLFIKGLSAYGIDAMQISLLRMAVAAPLFTLYLLIRSPTKLKIRLKDIKQQGEK